MGLVAIPMLQARRFGFAFMMRAAGITGGLALTAWFAAGGIIRERFSALSIGREAFTAARTGEPENSFEWRLVNWGLLISMGMEHPVTGHGAGMTTVLNPLTAENGVAFNAHDDFVRFFFEGGIVGLLLYVLYAFRLCRWAVRRAQSVTTEHAATAYAVAGAFLALFLLSGGTTELSLQTADLYQLYGMLALVTALPTSVDRAHKRGGVALTPTAARDKEGA